MTVFFVSDMHLTDNKPDIAQAFFGFMDKYQQDIHSLYLMGDLFEFWIGDQFSSPIVIQFKQRLAKLSQHSTIFIQHGNRDFLIGQTFCQQTRAQLLPDPWEITLHKTRALLSHGDIFCTDDIAYQRLRSILRSKTVLFLANALPYSIRHFVAQRIRSGSRQRQQKEYEHTQMRADINIQAIESTLNQYCAKLVIHGHTHKPGLHDHSNNCHRMVLGDWSADGGIFARLQDNQLLQLVRYCHPSQTEEIIAEILL
ncbi:UDP-2,3-diacylglucosamine diphosphatase [Gynuella sp.]|uniref:UDP-2,3-diacylglucosamine diphosphatase n=1 Tax=Gynuella sp. TaxID=2969146 RepID=UPI003D0CC667